MLERRNSARLPLSHLKIREKNGDYLFTYDAVNLSEDGVYVLNKMLSSSQDAHSELSFTLPDGHKVHKITARIVRENRKGEPKGCAYEFLQISEEARMALKRFLLQAQAS